MKKILLHWVLPTLVTVALLALVFQWIENPREIPSHIAQVPWHIHVIFILASLGNMVIRAYRWRALLPDHKLTGAECNGPIFIGFMFNSLLPARAGEFARSVALSRKKSIPFASVLGSVVLERVFDGFLLLASLALVFGLLGTSLPEEAVEFGEHTISAETVKHATTFLAISVVVLLAGIVSVLFPGPRRLIEATARAILPAKIAEPGVMQLEKLVAGFRALHSPNAVIEVSLWTVVVWVTVALSLWIVGFGFDNVAMSFAQAWAIMVFICIAISLPASPGYWGLYELGVIVAFKTLGLGDEAVALSYSIVIHFWQYVSIVIAGLFFLWIEGFKMSQLKHAEPLPDA